MKTRLTLTVVVTALAGLFAFRVSGAQERKSPAPATPPAVPNASPLPADYVVGPQDVLVVTFWGAKDMSGEVLVRPDGKISLPLINDVRAAGLTPDQLRNSLAVAAARLVKDPNVSVAVKEIRSRWVFVTGEVNKPGSYPLILPTSVIQLIATAGGLKEFADQSHITVVRPEAKGDVVYRVNLKDIVKGRKLQQNIALKPGDTIIVP